MHWELCLRLWHLAILNWFSWSAIPSYRILGCLVPEEVSGEYSTSEFHSIQLKYRSGYGTQWISQELRILKPDVLQPHHHNPVPRLTDLAERQSLLTRANVPLSGPTLIYLHDSAGLGVTVPYSTAK